MSHSEVQHGWSFELVRKYQLDSGVDGVAFFQGLPPVVSPDSWTDDNLFAHMTAAICIPMNVIRGLGPLLKPNSGVLFVSSTSVKNGSFDPAYGSAQAAKLGLASSLQRWAPEYRFNILTCGLVEGSPVHTEMSIDFQENHRKKARCGRLVTGEQVASAGWETITNQGLSMSNLEVGRET